MVSNNRVCSLSLSMRCIPLCFLEFARKKDYTLRNRAHVAHCAALAACHTIAHKEHTMPIRPDLLKLIICPSCQADLEEHGNALVCKECRLVYPVVNDIPVLLIDEAVPYEAWKAASQDKDTHKTR